MGTRQRRRDDEERTGGGPGGGGADGGGLEGVRNQADRLLQAGDDAIQRALSGNSEEFLRMSRQESGE